MVAFDLFLQDITYKEFFGACATFLAFAMYVPYFRQLLRKEIHPHAFTWLLWGILSAIIWFVQYTEEGGAGAWLAGFETVACLAVAILTLRNGVGYITKSDWGVFVVTLLALPVWFVTESPMASVILITGIDILSTYSTFRKAYISPFDESSVIYLSGGVELLLTLTAMDSFLAVNVINPICGLILNVSLGLLILVRQHMVRMANARLLSRRYATVRAELIKDTGWTARRQRLQERRYAHALRTVSNHCKTIGYETAHRWFNAA